MKCALFALTRGAVEKAQEIKSHLPGSDIYTLDKWDREGVQLIEGKFSDFLPGIFFSYKIHIFIMATGIVVRLLAPILKNKTVDPAVLVVDEKGEFVISLVSGHLGGANQAAREVAAAIRAVPVITTASDVTGRIAVDQLALSNGLKILDMEKAKEITALIVNGQKVCLKSDIPIEVPEDLFCSADSADGFLYISSRILEKEEKPSVQLVPRTVIAGMGCRKGCSKGQILEALAGAFLKSNRRIEALKTITSASIKREEKGLLEAAAFLEAEVKFFPVKQIAQVEDSFVTSEFVRDTIGVGAVAEPCAFLCAGEKGTKLLEKTIFPGVTVALWETPD